MINKLKRRFLIIGTVFMFILMSVLVLVMNIVNYREVTADADEVLSVLSQNGGLPFSEERQREEKPKKDNGFIPRGMSPEVPYESRFFTVTVSADGKIQNTDLSRIISVDENSVKDYTDKALSSKSARGFINGFRYLKTYGENETKIYFLDHGRKLDSFFSFLWISVTVGLGGCVIVFVAFIFTAGKIVSPIAESYNKQKRFISDAGHEIKTPLTIINANVDLLESEGGSEELLDIRQQTKRLTELTNNLILLSKMEESEHTVQKIDFPLSDLVSETASAFRALAVSQNKILEISVESNIVFNGSPDAIRQLTSILLENAVKYSTDNSEIVLTLKTGKKNAVLSVYNDTEEKIYESDLKSVFDRFFRSDKSRNSETGGHGIGLSVAKAIVEAHSGKIEASTKTGFDFCISAVLPINKQ